MDRVDQTEQKNPVNPVNPVKKKNLKIEPIQHSVSLWGKNISDDIGGLHWREGSAEK